MKESFDGKIDRREFLRNTALSLGGMALGVDKLSFLNEGNELDPAEKEKFIKERVERIATILREKKYDQVVTDPYLVSIFYYSDTFVNKMKSKEYGNSVTGDILKNIYPDLTLEFKKGYIEYLENLAYEQGFYYLDANEVAPLADMRVPTEVGSNHIDAIDVFVPEEGVEFFSMVDGVVVLAEDGWDSKNELSTSSNRGGNTVIIYNPISRQFYRFAHFESVEDDIVPGTFINKNTKLGKVGHTGMNASRPGHGKHIHIEIHPLSEQTIGNTEMYFPELSKKMQGLQK